MKRLLTLTVILVCVCVAARASHLKAATISYQHIEGLTYQVVVSLFSDGASPVSAGAGGILDFGDGTTLTLSEEEAQTTLLDNNTWKHEYSFVHMFPQASAYAIAYTDQYRNDGILNMENSAGMKVYLEAFLNGPATTSNSSPNIQQPPLGTAYLNETFYYNPMATDPDGDSLSYHLIPAKQAAGETVAGYTFPHKTFERAGGSETDEEAYLAINPATGDIIWDAPVRLGEYNLVLEIREWRIIHGEWVRIGTVEQDMQLLVLEPPAAGLRLEFPLESQPHQLEAGKPLEFSIRAIPDNPEDTVILELSGDFLQKHPAIVSSDSVGGKGVQALTIQYTPTETEAERYQLIATASLYNNTEETYTRSRAAYLLTPGYISGVNKFLFSPISLYPNPVPDNRFYLQSPELEGAALRISLFDTGGRLVHQQFLPSFSAKQYITVPEQELQGTYLLVVKHKDKLYLSRIIFSPQ